MMKPIDLLEEHERQMQLLREHHRRNYERERAHNRICIVISLVAIIISLSVLAVT